MTIRTVFMDVSVFVTRVMKKGLKTLLMLTVTAFVLAIASLYLLIALAVALFS